jgi:hypothetical protein
MRQFSLIILSLDDIMVPNLYCWPDWILRSGLRALCGLHLIQVGKQGH